jgi:hypothetical protein
MPGVAKALADQTDIALRLARARLADLSDEEFLWEPVAGCWSLRRKSAMAFVPPDASPGDWWIDGANPAPEPPPFTTAAWLVSHMTLGTWNWNDLIAGRAIAPEPALHGTAREAVELWSIRTLDSMARLGGRADRDRRSVSAGQVDLGPDVPAGPRRRPEPRWASGRCAAQRWDGWVESHGAGPPRTWAQRECRAERARARAG